MSPLVGPRVIALVGPTATGKTDLAMRIAADLDGEIVNADAMQLYCGMDIGTAKPTAAQRDSIPHHLLDLWPVSEPASVAAYQRRAVLATEQIHARGRRAIVTGGSGLYLRALLDDLRIPPTDPDVRRAFEQELGEMGPKALHDRLTRLDPAAAAAILPSNGRRVVRALEVVHLTGSFSATLPTGRYRWPDTVQVGLDRSDLDARIDIRVREMFAKGLVEEVRSLEQIGLRGSPTASKALGYAQILADHDPATAAAATSAATRRFARRQRSWFRRDSRITWFVDNAAGAAGDIRDLACRS